ncbi:hypothetical protein PtA15_4A544 [Puccinia triticina]|uniref:Anaphase-promoting complex subunit 4 WD40 domain-containing protein n=1 Tax=Puccinia triticina TaxID=208348 RepID=A0ABY7CGQ9_9BASI|nr:uncharacterized protein PtA15_4A544 [Puccinia triticina]WAQ84093.1 hypothetical protein PtA15_4A544 [Puccinia triticina]
MAGRQGRCVSLCVPRKPLWSADPSFSCPVSLRSITHDPALDLYVLVASDGRAYVAQMMAARSPPGWVGRCFHDPEGRPATGACALNFRFGLVALVFQGGAVDVYSLAPPAQPPVYSHSLAPHTPDPAGGAVASCAWTSDGHALAIAGPAGFAFWGPGNFELVLLAAPRAGADAQVFVVPFAKSAVATMHSPVSGEIAGVLVLERAS